MASPATDSPASGQGSVGQSSTGATPVTILITRVVSSHHTRDKKGQEELEIIPPKELYEAKCKSVFVRLVKSQSWLTRIACGKYASTNPRPLNGVNVIDVLRDIVRVASNHVGSHGTSESQESEASTSVGSLNLDPVEAPRLMARGRKRALEKVASLAREVLDVRMPTLPGSTATLSVRVLNPAWRREKVTAAPWIELTPENLSWLVGYIGAELREETSPAPIRRKRSRSDPATNITWCTKASQFRVVYEDAAGKSCCKTLFVNRAPAATFKARSKDTRRAAMRYFEEHDGR
jgi:hypothetical protein